MTELTIENKTRTEHSARNITYATIGKVSILIMGFISRIVFTHTLEQAYVGVNGLFYMILYALSLSELGLGTSISFTLYKPIVDGDIEKQKSLLKFYRGFFYSVAAVIFAAGLCLIPFMDVFVDADSRVDHLILIYMMYLVNCVLSYIGIYKRTILDANQLYHIWSINTSAACLVQQIIQIVVLVTTHNYLLFLIWLLVATVVANLLTSFQADRLYPFVNDKDVKPLDKDEKKVITRDLRAIIIQKLGDVAVNNTDNLLLSAIVGITTAGIYYIYYLIVESIRGVYVQVVQSITASVGNLGVSEDNSRVNAIFESIFLLGHWVYGVTAVCLYIILDEFVGMTFGQLYVFGGYMTALICVNFYTIGLCQASYLFRDSLGLFYFDKYRSIAAVIVNFAASIILGRMLGAEGIFLGTLVSTLTTSMWIEPVILYAKKFDKSVLTYFARLAAYVLMTLLSVYASIKVCNYISSPGWIPMIARGAVSFIIVNVIYLICTCWTPEFRLLLGKASVILDKMRNR